MDSTLLYINIGINPNIVNLGGLLITWHGVFTAVGILAGVWLAVRLATGRGFNEDDAYSVGLVVVGAGIVGARALYVIENYGDPGSGLHSVGDIFRINEGGISIYGAIIGGAVAGWAFGLWKKMPCAIGADGGGFGMLLGLAIGRIGDIINGEHFAKVSDLPWAVTYSHVNSPSFARAPQHPAVVYEMIGDLVIIGMLAVLWRRQSKSGVIFAGAFLLYSIMRFFVSYLRVDSEKPALGLSTPQVVSLIVMPVAALLLLFFLRRTEPELTPVQPSRPAIPRAELRRRQRSRPPAKSRN